MGWPVFEHADWNEFVGGPAFVNVPLRCYSKKFPFDTEVGDVVIIIENEEMHGVFAKVLSFSDNTDENGTPIYAEVDPIDSVVIG